MIDRIRTIMEYTKLSQQDFAARLGISPASLSSILTGRTNPTNKHIMGIHQGFPEINVNWLMFGEGDMLTGEHAVPPSNEPGENDGETGQQAATLQPIDPDAAKENSRQLILRQVLNIVLWLMAHDVISVLLLEVMVASL